VNTVIKVPEKVLLVFKWSCYSRPTAYVRRQYISSREPSVTLYGAVDMSASRADNPESRSVISCSSSHNTATVVYKVSAAY